MGLNILRSNCDCGSGNRCKCGGDNSPNWGDSVVNKPPNPDPSNFRITYIKEVGDCVIVNIKYPDCTNYEGNKILVYRDVHVNDIVGIKVIDPHFCDGDHISPIARFVPTVEGIDMAHDFCYMLKGKGI